MNRNADLQYSLAALKVLNQGERREDRTGVGTLSLFGDISMAFDMGSGFPLLTTKKMPKKGIVSELLWFLSGSTNILDIDAKHVREKWWAPFADDNGSLGPLYGYQWRYNGIGTETDPLVDLLDGLKNNPQSRRHVISMWDSNNIDKMGLPPCHGIVVQFYVHNAGKLSLKMYQRSADIFLGLPVNIASYALLLHIVAKHCGYEPHMLYITVGDAHIYLNHIDQIKQLMGRSPLEQPTLFIEKGFDILDNPDPELIHFQGYNSHGPITAPLAV